jgi:hypothetical protein
MLMALAEIPVATAPAMNSRRVMRPLTKSRNNW